MIRIQYLPNMVQAITVLTVLRMLTDAQTTCNNGVGRIVFERLPDQQLQGFDDDVVRDTSPPLRVLQRCEELCLKDRTAANNLVRKCESFDFQPGSRIPSAGSHRPMFGPPGNSNGAPEYEESTCYLTREQAHPDGIGNLVLVPNSVHFQKICLSSNRIERDCPHRQYVFERYSRKKLKIMANAFKEVVAANRSDCEEQCLNEPSFVCRSVTYTVASRSCSMTRFTRRTHPEAFEDDPGTDYLENTCLSPERRCDGNTIFVKEGNKGLAGAFEMEIFHGLSLEDCQSQCLRSEKYFCRSVEYDEQTRRCVLSDEDSVSQSQQVRATGPSANDGFPSASSGNSLYDLVCLDNPRANDGPDNSLTSHLFGADRRPDTAFQRYRNTRLAGEFHSEITGRSLAECLDECLRQPSFQCKSVVFSDRFRTCRLSRFSSKDGYRTIYDADYDYYENLMSEYREGSGLNSRPDAGLGADSSSQPHAGRPGRPDSSAPSLGGGGYYGSGGGGGYPGGGSVGSYGGVGGSGYGSHSGSNYGGGSSYGSHHSSSGGGGFGGYGGGGGGGSVHGVHSGGYGGSGGGGYYPGGGPGHHRPVGGSGGLGGYGGDLGGNHIGGGGSHGHYGGTHHAGGFGSGGIGGGGGYGSSGGFGGGASDGYYSGAGIPPGSFGPGRPTRCDEGDAFRQVGVRLRMRRQYVRRFTSAPSLLMCERECIEARDFICRSFNYRAYASPFGGTDRENCELSDRDSRDLDANNPLFFETTGDHDFYERFSGRAAGTECLDVSQVCSEDGMEFTLRTPEPFVGRIYTYGYYERCFFRGNGGTLNVLRVSGAHGYPDCGTQRFGDMMTNIVVVQFSDYVQTGRDKRFNLTCLFRGPGEAVVTSGYIGAGSGSPVPIEYLPAENSLSSRVRLLILYQGRPTTTIAVGDPLTFRLEAQDGYNYVSDIFATNVIARDPYTGRSVQLIDRYGCPVDNYVFPGLDRSREGDGLEARFNAFKIPESNFLVFEATVRTCRDGCQPAYCNGHAGRNEPSFGRRRRDVNDTIAPTLEKEQQPKNEANNGTAEDEEQIREMIKVLESRGELLREEDAMKLVSDSVCLTTGEYYGLISAVIVILTVLVAVAFLAALAYRRYWSIQMKNHVADRTAPPRIASPLNNQHNHQGTFSNSRHNNFSFLVPGLQKTYDSRTTLEDDRCPSPPAVAGLVTISGSRTFDDPSEPIYTDPSLFERSRSLRSIAASQAGLQLQREEHA